MSTLCLLRYKFSSILGRLSSLSHSAQARLLVFHHPIYTVKQESLKTLANCVMKRCGPLTLAFHMNYCSIMLLNCWKCETHLPRRTFFCDKCNTLQPVDYKLDHFEVMGIERTFDIDTDLLAKNFKKLQIQFHPDKFSLKSQKEHQMAVEHSTVINNAYRCLQQPVERALYLLDLAGKPLHEGQVDMDPDFLMKIMEINEELAKADDKDTVQAIGRFNQKILDELLREADVAFSMNDTETARQVVAKIKYYNNIYEKVRNYEREHGILD